MAPSSDKKTVKVWIAKDGMSEDDAIEIEIDPEDSLSKLLEIAFEKLYTKDVPIADIHFLPQGKKPLRKRQKVQTLNLDDTVFVKYKPQGNNFGGKTKEEIEAQVAALDTKLDEITQFKDKMKKLSDNEKDLTPLLKEIKTRININESFTNKQDALAHLANLERETSALKFQLMTIDFKSLNIESRCKELLQLKGVRGFDYSIKKPIVAASAKTKTYKFSSVSEQAASKKACLSIKKKGSWGVEFSVVGFAYGGLGMASSEYTNKSSSSYETDVSASSNILSKVAVARTTALQEIVTFEIEKAVVDEEGVKLLKTIAKASDEKGKEEAAFKFLDEYPAEINMGPFGIGGYFEYTATTTSTKEVSLHKLQKRAAAHTENQMTVAGKAFYGAAAASFGVSVKNETEQGGDISFNDGLSNEEVTTKIEYECSGPTVSDMESLQKNLTDSNNWSCFPSIAVSNHKFRKIYTIVQDMANEGRELDTDLDTAAKVLQYIIETGPKTFIGEPSIPKDAKKKNVIVFGKTGSGKSSLGCVLLGRYDKDGFEVDNSKESCTQESSSKENDARKIKYYDTVGSFDTKAFKENTGVFTANKKILQDIIKIWETVGNDGIHAILIALSFKERGSALEAKLAKFAGTHLFDGDASRCMLLIMTKSDEIYYSSDIQAKKYLDKESKISGNHFIEFYKLVDFDHTRVIFVDCQIPKYYQAKKEFQCKQHNVWMAEKVLNKIHQLSDKGVVVPVKTLVKKKKDLNKKLEEEKKKDNPDPKTIDEINDKIKENDEKIKTKAEDRSKSCLHENTKILLANKTMKKICEIKVNDQILDRYLQPQKVIGINYTYLGDRNMYQFANDGPLFTADHQFYTSMDTSTTVVASLEVLLKENPQLVGEDIKEMRNGSSVLRYETLSEEIQNEEIFLKEYESFEAEAKVYFMEVSGDGSYIADNYVAKHELPDLAKYPLTNICYAKVLQIYKKLDKERKFPVSLQGSKLIHNNVMKIKTLWKFIVEFDVDMQEDDDDNPAESMEYMTMEQAMEELPLILNETDTAWFAMYLNQVCTRFLWEHLESEAIAYDVKMERISKFVKAAYMYLNR